MFARPVEYYGGYTVIVLSFVFCTHVAEILTKAPYEAVVILFSLLSSPNVVTIITYYYYD